MFLAEVFLAEVVQAGVLLVGLLVFFKQCCSPSADLLQVLLLFSERWCSLNVAVL